MKLVILFLFFSSFALSQSKDLNSMNKIAKRCDPFKSDEPLYANEFKWGYEIQELISKFIEIYNSNKRLPQNAYWDQSKKQLLLPISKQWGNPVPIHETFIQSISRHIEKAFELKVIDGVFFPDMGHSHLLIPEAHYKKNYQNYVVSEFSKKYESFFKDPLVEVLYHTAEQLKMLNESGQVLDDPYIQFRHKTRNPVGKLHIKSELKFLENKNSEANTAGAPDGYVWWGAGFNLSANQNGCFAYRKNGEIFYYDISLYDLEYSPDHGEVFNNF